MDKILNRPQAAKFLTVSLSTLDRLLADKAKAIPFKKLNIGKTSRILFSQEELTWWVTTHEKNMEDPARVEADATLIMGDRSDAKELSNVCEQSQAVIKNLMVICQKEIDEGVEESEPLEGDEGDVLKKMHEEVVSLSDKIEEIEKRMYERAQERFNLEKELKKAEVTKAPVHEHYMAVDPRLNKR